MGLCVALQSEDGEQSELIADEKNLLSRLIGYPDPQAFTILASIDYCGDTTFNRMQTRRVLAEWETLYQKAATPDKVALLDAIKTLALKCQNSAHQYVVFIGD
jgi:hypothetical protein